MSPSWRGIILVSASRPRGSRLVGEGRMSVKVMTVETLAQHDRVGIPADCVLCDQPIREREAYTGGGLMMTCALCAVQQVMRRIDEARLIIEDANNELREIEHAVTALR